MPKHARRRFDDDDFTADIPPNANAGVDTDIDPDIDTYLDTYVAADTDPDGDVGVDYSTYHEHGVLHGPQPVPRWVITSPAAVDVDLGVLKTGKEAEVSLIRRELGGVSSLLAAKRYRSADHRLFHRDAQYLEGRKERRSRERRAMATRTSFGRDLIAGRWAQAEFEVLGRLWIAGAAVPYPVQLRGTELMMEFIGSADGVAAPRLAQLRPELHELPPLFEQLRDALSHLALAGFAHGDLSAYNVLVDDGRLVLIDVPQAVDLVGNPRGADFLRRDCANIAAWFNARGLSVDSDRLAEDLIWLAR